MCRRLSGPACTAQHLADIRKAAQDARNRKGTALCAMEETMMGRGRHLQDQVEGGLRWCGSKLVALPPPTAGEHSQRRGLNGVEAPEDDLPCVDPDSDTWMHTWGGGGGGGGSKEVPGHRARRLCQHPHGIAAPTHHTSARLTPPWLRRARSCAYLGRLRPASPRRAATSGGWVSCSRVCPGTTRSSRALLRGIDSVAVSARVLLR